MNPYVKANEWLLLADFRWAAKNENYAHCAEITAEMNRRIDAGTADLTLLIDGNRNHLDGEVNFKDFSPMLNRLRGLYPERFTKQAAADYLLTIPVNRQAINKMMKP